LFELFDTLTSGVSYIETYSGNQMTHTNEQDKTTDHINEEAAIVRSMIEHCSVLRNDRIKTMLTLQSVLFAALAFVWKANKESSFLIAVVGIIASTSLADHIRSAERAIKGTLSWWEKRAKQNTYDGPPVLSESDVLRVSRFGRWRPVGLLEFAFGIAWGVILIITIIKF
jgi:hypothetical protein